MVSVIEDSLKKETPRDCSESSDSKDDGMSFDSAYETCTMSA